MNLYNILKLKLFFSSVILLFLFFATIGFYGFVRYRINTPLNMADGEEKIFIIAKGEGVKEIAVHLEKENLIRGAFYFEMHIWFQNIETKMQAGEYLISPKMSIKDMARKFSEGDVVSNEMEVTFPEGFTIRDMEERLAQKGFENINLSQFKPIFFGSRFSSLRDINAVNLEGFLFPDTYNFNKLWSSREIIEKMLGNFDEKISPDLSLEINRQGKNIFDIVIMASIIEKEVRTGEDKKLVSGILWKRWSIGMPLQADATVVYASGKKNGYVTFEDLKIQSPYNTYLYAGLPIGPISNSGLESIVAAIYPQSSDFWYYLSKPSGETVFSKTLTEHNNAKIKYLK